MKKVSVLGCGLVGGLIARDLAADFEVTVYDVSEEALAKMATRAKVKTVKADLSDRAQVAAAARGADLAVSAVPGFMGFATVRAILEEGRNVADISFMPEDQLALDGVAKEHGVTAVVDCGVSPGLSNLFVGRAAAELGTIENGVILVGGLPVKRVWPYEYSIVFSAVDVLEEYTRPARLIENGQVVVKPALSEVELVDIPEVGTLEAFNSDGLRTLLRIPAKNLKEKTMRFPGHADRMRMLRESGFLSLEPLDVGGGVGVKVKPFDVTSRLLFKAWKLQPGEEEFTSLRVVCEGGKEAGRRLVWNLYDRFDRERGETSMARTTGFPCAIMARMMLQGRFGASQKGVIPLELLARDDAPYRELLAELAKRDVRIDVRDEPAA
jgi:lysine 6-dehydrogenase